MDRSIVWQLLISINCREWEWFSDASIAGSWSDSQCLFKVSDLAASIAGGENGFLMHQFLGVGVTVRACLDLGSWNLGLL